ncbi:MAG: hypothetical protein JOS17DRAFT_10970 [Linnemannia elongata]|nr:MAG: hypothetical protein JOS17DRAFT_10970 [Linnemannia elongata]
MASTFSVNKRTDNRLSINNLNSEYNYCLRQQQPNTNPPQSSESMTSSSAQRAGRPSQAAFSSHGPSSSESSQHSSRSSSSSSSSTSSRSSTNDAPPALVRYTLTDNPVRAQLPRQPAHRSKLSKQYSPSDSEDSDDEPLALQSSRQSTYMSGPLVELNSATESLRAISRMDMDQTAARPPTPIHIQESVDTTRVKTLSSKLSLAKRISRLFGGGSKNSKISSRQLSREATPSTSVAEGAPYQNKLPSIEIINDVLKQELHPRNMSIHQHQSHPIPEYAYISGGESVQNTQYTRRTATRESSLNTIDVGNSRPYSASTGPSAPSTPTTPTSSHHPLQRQRSPSGANHTNHSNRSSMSGVEDLDFDQLPHRPYGQDPRYTPSGSPVLPATAISFHSRDNSDNTRSSSPRSTTPMEEHLRVRRNTVNDASTMFPSAAGTTPPRRSSTPLIVSETLVSRIDREKSTVCFQVPNAKRDSYSRDANLDPVLTSLVQQHRKDYQTNLRLGGVPEVTPQSLPHAQAQTTAQPFVLPQLHSSPLLTESLLPNTRDREMRGPASRRDSTGPNASPMAGPHPTHPLGAPNRGTPGLLPTESHSRRLSSSQIQTALNPYISDAKGTYSGSHGNLLNAAAISSVKLQQQQQQQLFRQLQNYQQVQQPSPQLTPQGPQPGSQIRHRPSSKRHSGSSYFNISPQQKPYSVAHSTAHVSPFPSPVIGMAGSTMGYTHELSVAMQHQQYQQQQVQLQIQQQQLHNLQQQQVQQLSPNYQVSPLALLQNQNAQQQLQQQQNLQQLEQLQQIRMQQQQLLLQQQQQLQQQLEQAGAAVTASTTTAAISPLIPDIATVGITSPQQQQQQLSMVNHSVPLHFALPAAPVLTTAMGLGMGMNMSPLSVMGMGVGLQQPTMIPQLVMTPPLTPQLVGYTTPMHPYQQIPTSAIPTGHVPVHATTGRTSAGSPAVVGY